MGCAGVSRALLGYFTTHRNNLYWMCDKCVELFENSHLRSIAIKTNDPAPLDSLTKAITELRTEIKQLTTSSSRSASSPAPKIWPVLEPKHPLRTPRLQVAVPRSVDKCLYGSKATNQDVVSVPTYSEQKKFWLYMSRIRPDVTNELVLGMVKSNLNLNEDPDIVKLVPKGKGVSSLTFISFKIGLDPELKTQALDPSTWPEGIMFREFEEYGTQKFWKPMSTSTSPSTAISPITTQLIATPSSVSPSTSMAANPPT